MEKNKVNVTFREAIQQDAPLIQSWWNDGRIMAPVGFPNGLAITIEDVQKAIETYAALSEGAFWLILTPAKEPIGEFCFSRKDAGAFTFDLKIGAYDQQRKGYGKAAVLQGLEYLFDTYQPEKILIDVNPRNLPAVELYQSIGFQAIAYQKDSWVDQSGNSCDTLVLELRKTQ